EVWVSDLALIIRPRDQVIEGFVLNANSGEPIKGARVDGWYPNYRNNRLVSISAMHTDENGMFRFKPETQSGANYIFRARIGEQEIGTMNQIYHGWWKTNSDREQVVLFTDRAIY